MDLNNHTKDIEDMFEDLPDLVSIGIDTTYNMGWQKDQVGTDMIRNQDMGSWSD